PFFIHVSPDHQHLHPFPTRRSSDLESVWPKSWTHRFVVFSHENSPPDFVLQDHGFWRQSGATPKTPRAWARRSPATEFSFPIGPDRKSTRLNSSHDQISYAVFCLKK